MLFQREVLAGLFLNLLARPSHAAVQESACESALLISNLSTFTAELDSSTITDGGWTCFASNKQFFYQVTPDDQCYVASLSAAYTEVPDAQKKRLAISLMTGGCETRQCIAESQTSDDEGPSIAFRADDSYLLSFEDAASPPSNTIIMVASTSSIQCSSLCESPTLIQGPFPAVATGNTKMTMNMKQHSADVPSCINYRETNVEFFQVLGTGSCMEATIDAAFSSVMGVLSGDCFSLVCEDSNRFADSNTYFVESANSILWATEAGVEYKLIVAGRYEGSEGAFDLTMREVDCPPALGNYLCNTASLFELGTRVNASNVMAPVVETDALSSCPSLSYYRPQVSGVWYTFVGDGLCRVPSGPTEIAIYTGGCGSLQCATENGQSFVAVLGEVYNAFVYADGDRGSMSLELTYGRDCEWPRPVNDECSTPRIIKSLPFYEEGALLNLTEEPPAVASYRCGALASTRVQWYEVVGDGTCIEVHIKSPSSDELVFGVLTGNDPETCTDLDCVVQNLEGNTFRDRASFQTVAGERYKIGIAPRYYFAAGVFSLSIQAIADCAYTCAQATSVTQTKIQGDTTATGGIGESEYEVQHCVNEDGESNVEYFKVKGTGGCIEAAVESTFEPTISLMTGSCASLVCLDKSFDEGRGTFGGEINKGAHRRLLWRTEMGVENTLVIGGSNVSQRGEFVLTLDDVACPPASTNSVCRNAETLGPSEGPVQGDLVMAPPVDPAVVSTCSSLRYADPERMVGLWYQFEGDGLCRSVTLDPHGGRGVAVFKGDCEALECVADSENVSFQAEAGEVFKIFVSGTSERGIFHLGVSTDDSCEGTDQKSLGCSRAVTIAKVPFEEKVDFNFEPEHVPQAALTCDIVRDYSTSIWFELNGDGRCFRASTLESDIDTLLAVYKTDDSEDCTDLVCIGKSENQLGSGRVTSGVTWETVEGISYKILLGSRFHSEQLSFSVFNSSGCRYDCTQASPIVTIPSLVEGDAFPPGSFDYNDESLGYWTKRCISSGLEAYYQFFNVEGTGSCIEATVISAFVPSSVAVLVGGCTNLVCLDKTHDETFEFVDYTVEESEKRRLLWLSQAGEEYSLVVSWAQYEETGPFSINIEEVDCPQDPSNKVCEDAHLLDLSVPSLESSFKMAPLADLELVSSCDSFQYREAERTVGLWYEFEGDGFCRRISIAPHFNRNTAVFTGDCGSLQCVANYDYESFRAEVGKVYKAFVYGESERGGFRVNLDFGTSCEAEPPQNDACLAPIVVDSLPYFIVGEMLNATSEPLGSSAFTCDVLREQSGTIWFEMIGDGSCYMASLEGTSFDTIIAVYEDDGLTACTDMKCVAQNDDSSSTSGGWSRSTWQTRDGVKYKVMVGTYGAAEESGGGYHLNITELDECPKKCQVCADGSSPQPGASFRNQSCEAINDEIMLVDIEDGNCALYEVIGWAYCGCPATEVEEFCNICGVEGFIVEDPTTILGRAFDEPTCNRLIDAPAIRGNETCASLWDAIDGNCACVEQASCTLCKGNAIPFEIEKVVPSIVSPTNKTCGDWVAEAESQTFPACNGLAEDGISVADYCCPHRKPTSNCNYECATEFSAATVLQGLGSVTTCGEAKDLLGYVKADQCQSVLASMSVCCAAALINATGDVTEPTSPKPNGNANITGENPTASAGAGTSSGVGPLHGSWTSLLIGVLCMLVDGLIPTS